VAKHGAWLDAIDRDAGPGQVQLPHRDWPTLAKRAAAMDGAHHGVRRGRSDARSDQTGGRRARRW